MTDNDPFADVASEITGWQAAALSLPLPEVSDIARDSIAHLGCVLNTFNQVHRDQRDGQASAEALADAVGDVARQATAAAIYTLAVTHRTRQAAALS